jgi:hypothetical protein
MHWADLEKTFSAAAVQACSRRQWLMAFVALCVAGLFFVLCRAVAVEASPWIAMSLTFLPILFSSGVLLPLGILLIRAYTRESKQTTPSLQQILVGSVEVIAGASSLSIPSLFAYMVLWILLGFFVLLRDIPLIGPFINVLLAFGPFLLIFGSIALCCLNLGILFFLAPAAAWRKRRYWELANKVGKNLAACPLSALVLLGISLLPLGVIGALLYVSTRLTNFTFAVNGSGVARAMESFVLMLPFAALLAPAVVFFFIFAAESAQLLQRKQRDTL